MHVQDVKIVHFVPGRVRFRIKGLRNDSELKQRIKELFESVPGVTKIDVNQQTESVLIQYERCAVTSDDSRQALKRVMESLFPQLDVDELLGWLASMHQ